MATYKVLQDIEADDKFVGPLSLKQFIYAAITGVSLYISFLGITRGAWPLAVFLLPVSVFGGFLSWPWSKDQPTEVWLLAKIRFGLKPRRRIWDQNGMKQLVTITVPKKVEQYLTNGLSQVEVKSRLQALANTIDSRGWAIKNVNLNMYSQPSYVTAITDSDRLVDPASLPQNVPGYDITAVDDILDENANPTAQHFTEMITASAQTHRQQAVAKMQGSTAQNPGGDQTTPNYWFMNQTPATDQPADVSMFATQTIVAPGTQTATTKSTPANDDETALLEKIHKDQNQPDPTNYHMRVLSPASSDLKAGKTTTKGTQKIAQATSTPTPDPAIIDLANNDDLNVATIARQADKVRNQLPEDEVVISLH